MAEKAEFMEEFGCPGCGTTGHAVWREEAETMRKLVELSDGFVQAPGGDPSVNSEITCVKCGAKQPEQQRPLTR
jgi:hypothetical protein